MDLISIIVPIYNVEAYLDRCIRSIVEQTYTNLEIILVDDGSPDSCPIMCDTWAKKDPRIKVIHKENGGLSDARNAGMNTATGKYIVFIDSDDWIHRDYAQALYRACVETGALISACDVSTVFEEESLKYQTTNVAPVVFSCEEALSWLTKGEKVRAVAWNKLYCSELLKNEMFPVDRYHEDEFFTYRIIAKAPKIAYVDVPMYFYFQRAGSIMNSPSLKHLDALDAALERIRFLQEVYPHLHKRDKALFCAACVNMYRGALEIPEKNRKEYKRRIKRIRAELQFSLCEMFRYSTKEKVYIIGSRVCIGTLSAFLNAKRKRSCE